MHFLDHILPINTLLIRTITIVILSLNSHLIQGQDIGYRQNPPSVKWQQLNTKNFQIIYPPLLETEAQRMANTLEKTLPAISSSLRKKPRKISIFLQNQGTESNGFVTLAPRHSEFFAMPPQEFDYQDWLNSLAVHELRHVVQFDRLSGKFRPPFFEGLGLAIFGITLPPWFPEGDAVTIETALTNAGRGRLPEWNIAFRTNTLSEKKFSYSKDFFGSLKDITPGYYQLGYYITTKLRRDKGETILDSLYDRMAGSPLRPYNFSNSVKKFTGSTTDRLHDSTVSELDQLWELQLKSVQPETYPILKKRKTSLPESYLLPASIEGSASLLFLKQSREKTPEIILLDSLGKEHQIIKFGIQEKPHFSYARGKVVWDEFRYDVRYQQRSFNVINSYDMRTGKYQQLTHKSRLFAPSLSPDGNTIIAVDISYSNEVSLALHDTETGEELKKYASPGNYMLQTPSFSTDGKRVVVTAVCQAGKTLFELDCETGIFTQLLPFQQQLISRPVYADGQIVFKAHYNGIDNLYRLNPETGKIYQLTNVPFGAFNPSFDSASRKIYFNNYQVIGYDIASIPFNKSKGASIDSIRNTAIQYIQPVVEQEGNPDVFADIPQKKYSSKSYREINNLFYFHSLLPIAEESNYDNYNLGIKLQSNNKLNTMSFYTGWRFNNALKKSEYLTGFTYARFYPVLDFSYANHARLAYRQAGTEENPALLPVNWREHYTEASVRVPFIFNQRNHVYQTGFKIASSYTSRYQITNQPQSFIENISFPMSYQVYFSQNNLRSTLDLAPRWGQNLQLTYRHFPFEPAVSGELLTFKSNFYFPGVWPNHSLQASFNYQQGIGTYWFINDIPLISGYSSLQPEAELRNTLLLDYRFPLFYPDWEIGPLAYVKRFKGGFFADFQNIGKGNDFAPKSFGFELRADMNLLRFYLPNFDIGGKIIFLNEKPGQNPIFEPTLSYSL